jgi:hypothetical protein
VREVVKKMMMFGFGETFFVSFHTTNWQQGKARQAGRQEREAKPRKLTLRIYLT